MELGWRGNSGGTRVLYAIVTNRTGLGRRYAYIYPKYTESNETMVKMCMPNRQWIGYTTNEPIQAVIEHDVKKTLEEIYNALDQK